MAYVTKQEIKYYLGVTWDAGLDTYIDKLIASATDYIERACGDKRFGKRYFEAPSPDTDQTRYFDGLGETKLYIGDLRSLTSVTYDGDALTEGTDFFLYPLNASQTEEPYTSIELAQIATRVNVNSRISSSAPYVFDRSQKMITIVGKWGYSATPPEDIQVACMKIVGGIIKENIGDEDLREIRAESLGEYSVTYSSVKDIANRIEIDALLTPYKRQLQLPENLVIAV